MEAIKKPGMRTQRRCSAEEKAAEVRMVRTLRKELTTTNDTVKQVLKQLGYGVESVHVSG